MCLLLIVLSSGWTLPGTSRPPGAALCVIWVQVEVWFQGCSPTCWQAGGDPVREDPVSPQTLPPLIPPLRRSWRRITTATLSTLDSTNTSTDIPETLTVSDIVVREILLYNNILLYYYGDSLSGPAHWGAPPRTTKNNKGYFLFASVSATEMMV